MRIPSIALAALAALGCAHRSSRRSGAAELIASIDLPRQLETQELSGTFYDLPTRTLWAVQDNTPQLVPLVFAPDLSSLRVGTPIRLEGRSTVEWDGEALARGGDGAWWVVTVERDADVERFAPEGEFLDRVAVPVRFETPANARMGIESFSFSPSGEHWFLANEDALMGDGPIAGPYNGTVVRILRHDVARDTNEERAYRTDRAPADGTLGVSDVTALDERDLLVLERGFAVGYGNTARIYRVDFEAAPDVSKLDAIVSTTPALHKQLVVDLRKLRLRGVTNPEEEPNPLLANYEGLALGPVLRDGRRVVFVTSDDNASPTQIARVLVLAIAVQ